jgi:hypothetical protein
MQLADPDDSLLGKQIRQSTGTLAITAEKDGRHEYCFSNQMSSIADKIVRYVYLNTLLCVDHIYHIIGSSFNVHGVIFVAENGTFTNHTILKRLS